MVWHSPYQQHTKKAKTLSHYWESNSGKWHDTNTLQWPGWPVTSYPDYIKNVLGDMIHPIFTSLPLLTGCILEKIMWSHDLIAKWWWQWWWWMMMMMMMMVMTTNFWGFCPFTWHLRPYQWFSFPSTKMALCSAQFAKKLSSQTPFFRQKCIWGVLHFDSQ